MDSAFFIEIYFLEWSTNYEFETCVIYLTAFNNMKWYLFKNKILSDKLFMTSIQCYVRKILWRNINLQTVGFDPMLFSNWKDRNVHIHVRQRFNKSIVSRF